MIIIYYTILHIMYKYYLHTGIVCTYTKTIEVLRWFYIF